MEQDLKLKGLNVVFFESRFADTMGSLIKLQGGDPISAPSMKEVPLENNPDAFLFGDKLFKNQIDVLILLTGVGAKALMTVLETRYPREKILEALRKISVISRGPKSLRVMKEWELTTAFTVPEPNTWKDILETFDKNVSIVPLRGKNVAVQEYGVANQELLSGLEGRGAKVLRVPVYRWALPDDIEPLKNAVKKMIAGEVQIAVFTTAIQIEHLFQVAEKLKIEASLQNAFKKIVVASVGPDCSKAIESRGIHVDVEPESPKMGPLVLKTAEKAREILSRKR